MARQSSRAGGPSSAHDHMDQVAGSSGSRKDDLQPTGNTRKRHRMNRPNEPPSIVDADTSSTADIPDAGIIKRQKRKSDHSRPRRARQRLAPLEKKRKVMRRMELSQLKSELKASQKEKEEVEAEWEETQGMMNADLAEVRRELRVISDQSKDSSRVSRPILLAGLILLETWLTDSRSSRSRKRSWSLSRRLCVAVSVSTTSKIHTGERCQSSVHQLSLHSSLACGHIACKLWYALFNPDGSRPS